MELYERSHGWPGKSEFEGKQKKLWVFLDRFAQLAHTIGNFTYIPYMSIGNRITFNTRRGSKTGCLPACGKPVRDYWDLSLEWLKERGIPQRWTGLVPEGCPEAFEKYVELARLEFYCVDDNVVKDFLRSARKKDASPADIRNAYDEVRERAKGEENEKKYAVKSFWGGHQLSNPDSYEPESIDQITSFLKAVNRRIEARGRLLIALHEEAKKANS